MKKYFNAFLTTTAMMMFMVMFVSCSGEKSWLEELFPDVYTVGYEYNERGVMVATLWKNKKKTQLSKGIKDAEANTVFVTDNHDVYVGGWEVEYLPEFKDDFWVAKVWKNGQEHFAFPDAYMGDIGYDATPFLSVFVSGNDVYLAGHELADFEIELDGEPITLESWFVPLVLKNNRRYYDFGDGSDIINTVSGHAETIFVYGNDVYVGGYGHIYWELNPDDNMWLSYSAPLIWKNGSLLYQLSSNMGAVFSLSVDKDHVYAAGYVEGAKWPQNDPNNNRYAQLWIDGAAAYIGSGTSLSSASSIHVSGDDIFIALYEHDGNNRIAKYWKGNKNNSISSQPFYSTMHTYGIGRSYGIYGHGGNVYSVGSESHGNYDVAKFWINGEPYTISDGNRNAQAWSIAVK